MIEDHKLSFQGGEAEAFFAGKPAWHQYGTVVEQAPKSAEAIRLAHLDWRVEKRQVTYDDSQGGMGLYEFKNRFATVRSDTHFPFGIVGKDYEVLQNTEAFEFMDSLVQQEDLKYEAAGALKDGRIIWVLARMREEFYLTSDDPMRNYMLLTNGHDGSKTVSITPTNVRVVCWNTLQAAMGSSKSAFHIRHSGQMRGKIDEARLAFNFATDRLHSMNSVLKMFSTKTASKDQVSAFINVMFPMPVLDTSADMERHERAVEKIHGVRDQVVELFEGHKFNQTTASKGTAFGLLNSYTQWADHERKTNGIDDWKRGETRFRRSLFGKGVAEKEKAFNTLRSMYGV